MSMVRSVIREHDRLPVGQPLDVVVEGVDGLVPQGRQLGVHRGEVGLPHGVAGQVDLPQDVRRGRHGRVADRRR